MGLQSIIEHEPPTIIEGVIVRSYEWCCGAEVEISPTAISRQESRTDHGITTTWYHLDSYDPEASKRVHLPFLPPDDPHCKIRVSEVCVREITRGKNSYQENSHVITTVENLQNGKQRKFESQFWTNRGRALYRRIIEGVIVPISEKKMWELKGKVYMPEKSLSVEGTPHAYSAMASVCSVIGVKSENERVITYIPFYPLNKEDKEDLQNMIGHHVSIEETIWQNWIQSWRDDSFNQVIVDTTTGQKYEGGTGLHELVQGQLNSWKAQAHKIQER